MVTISQMIRTTYGNCFIKGLAFSSKIMILFLLLITYKQLISQFDISETEMISCMSQEQRSTGIPGTITAYVTKSRNHNYN